MEASPIFPRVHIHDERTGTLTSAATGRRPIPTATVKQSVNPLAAGLEA
jgi:hypothetical protein